MEIDEIRDIIIVSINIASLTKGNRNENAGKDFKIVFRKRAIVCLVEFLFFFSTKCQQQRY